MVREGITGAPRVMMLSDVGKYSGANEKYVFFKCKQCWYSTNINGAGQRKQSAYAEKRYNTDGARTRSVQIAIELFGPWEMQL